MEHKDPEHDDFENYLERLTEAGKDSEWSPSESRPEKPESETPASVEGAEDTSANDSKPNETPEKVESVESLSAFDVAGSLANLSETLSDEELALAQASQGPTDSDPELTKTLLNAEIAAEKIPQLDAIKKIDADIPKDIYGNPGWYVQSAPERLKTAQELGIDELMIELHQTMSVSFNKLSIEDGIRRINRMQVAVYLLTHNIGIGKLDVAHKIKKLPKNAKKAAERDMNTPPRSYGEVKARSERRKAETEKPKTVPEAKKKQLLSLINEVYGDAQTLAQALEKKGELTPEIAAWLRSLEEGGSNA